MLARTRNGWWRRRVLNGVVTGVLTGVLMVVAVACGDSEPSTVKETDVQSPDVITVSSTAFAAGETIPARFTCDGENESPPLAWRNVPEDASALALVVDDPDAPNGTFVHWVVLDIPVTTSRVDAGETPAGAIQATNSAGKASYFGPCPPSGTHHYRFTVYALSQPTDLADGIAPNEALDAVERNAIAHGRLVGTYTR